MSSGLNQFHAPIIGRGVALQTPTADGTIGQAIVTDGAGVLSFATISGGGGSPAGSGTELQYRNGSSFGAVAGSVWNGTNLTLPAVLALQAHRGHDNGTMVGFEAGLVNSAAVCVGFQAGGDYTNRVANDQLYSVCVGRHAGYSHVGGNTVCIGHAAGHYAYSSSSAVHIGYETSRNPGQVAGFTSFGAVTIGTLAAQQLNAHEYSVIVGYQAGQTGTRAIQSVMLGYKAGSGVLNADASVIIGMEAGNGANNCQCSVLIGKGSGKTLNRSYSLVIDGDPGTGSAGTTALIYGEFDNRRLRFNGYVEIAGAAGVNGQSLGIKSLTELLTIAAAATSTTTIQKPANSIVLAVSVRVTTAVTCTSTFTVGDSTDAVRFSTAAVSKAVNSTNAGTKAGAYYNATAQGIIITPDTTPSDATGRVRVTIHYLDCVPPTS